jgi:arylsulfatase A-like enzyme
VRTIAERMKQAGWATAGFTANGNGGSLAGLERGFDVFEDPTRTYTKDARGTVYNNLPTGDFIVNRVLGHLEKGKAKREFLFVFLVDPHDPYGARPDLEKMFLDPAYKAEPRRKALWEFNNNYSPEERASMIALYDAGIRSADEAIGKLVDGLRKMGVWDKTSLFVSADHGEGFGEHGFYLHAHHFWEEVIHVPLIARAPKLAAGNSKRLVDATDVAATIVALGGAKSTGLTGVSLLETAAAPKHVISEYNEFGIKRQAIMDGRWKVIWQRPADEAEYMREVKDKKFFPSVSFTEDVVHVFDLAADPLEKNNLAAKMPAEAAKLLEELRTFVLKPVAEK